MSEAAAMRMEPCCQATLLDLPSHVQAIVARLLHARDLKALHLASRQTREAARSSVHALDLQGNPSLPWEWSSMPEALVEAILSSFPHITTLRVPGGWREAHLQDFLRMAEGRWVLEELEVHFHAVTTCLIRSLAATTPQLTALRLFLDMPFQCVSNQARRITALGQLPALEALSCEAPLGTEALRALSTLPKLQQLDLSVAVTTHEPGASLEALGQLTQLTQLRFSWAAGRTMGSAAPLAQLSRLRCLHVFIGAGDAFPPCSGRPLEDLLPVLGQLGQLTELVLLQGLRMVQDLGQISELQQLEHLQVLGLHDSLLREGELQLLSRFPALQQLQVDTLQLIGSSLTTSHPLVLPNLKSLMVNTLHLNPWHLADIAPNLTHLGPLTKTLDPRGFGASVHLPTLIHHPKLCSLGLCLTALKCPRNCSQGCSMYTASSSSSSGRGRPQENVHAEQQPAGGTAGRGHQGMPSSIAAVGEGSSRGGANSASPAAANPTSSSSGGGMERLGSPSATPAATSSSASNVPRRRTSRSSGSSAPTNPAGVTSCNCSFCVAAASWLHGSSWSSRLRRMFGCHEGVPTRHGLPALLPLLHSLPRLERVELAVPAYAPPFSRGSKSPSAAGSEASEDSGNGLVGDAAPAAAGRQGGRPGGTAAAVAAAEAAAAGPTPWRRLVSAPADAGSTAGTAAAAAAAAAVGTRGSLGQLLPMLGLGHSQPQYSCSGLCHDAEWVVKRLQEQLPGLDVHFSTFPSAR